MTPQATTYRQPDPMVFDKPWTCTPSVDFEKGAITLEVQDWSGRITREIMQTKEHAIRQALIALGWTPPTEPHPWMEKK